MRVIQLLTSEFFAYIWEFRFTTFYAKHAYFVFTDAYFGMFQVRIMCCFLFFSVVLCCDVSNSTTSQFNKDNWAQRKKLRGKNKCFIFAVKKFYDYET